MSLNMPNMKAQGEFYCWNGAEERERLTKWLAEQAVEFEGEGEFGVLIKDLDGSLREVEGPREVPEGYRWVKVPDDWREANPLANTAWKAEDVVEFQKWAQKKGAILPLAGISQSVGHYFYIDRDLKLWWDNSEEGIRESTGVKEFREWTTGKKGHPHAEQMALYAEDAKETESPWERWEWQEESEVTWTNCLCNPGWHKEERYRRKPKLKVGDQLESGTIVAITEHNYVVQFGDEEKLIKRGEE